MGEKLERYLNQAAAIGENLESIRESIAVELEDGESAKEAAALRIQDSITELLGLLTAISLYGED